MRVFSFGADFSGKANHIRYLIKTIFGYTCNYFLVRLSQLLICHSQVVGIKYG